MYGIFLDDERNPSDVTWESYPDVVEWFVVRNSAMFFEIVADLADNGEEFIVSFDHDIQDYNERGKETTGYDCLKLLCEMIVDYGWEIPDCYFHSRNPVGKRNMEMYYLNFLEHY